MKNLFNAGKLLLLDLASTLFFLVIYLTTHNIPLAVVLGIALGVGQIGWQLARKRPIDTMQWLSLFLIVASGTATLLTRDRRGEYATMRTIGLRRRRARGLPIPA